MINLDDLTYKQIKEIAALASGLCRQPSEAGHVTPERPVIVRSTGGVYFGYLVRQYGTEVRLLRARHIRTWTSTGLAGSALGCSDLAIYGAGAGSSITARVDTDLPTVHGIFDCTIAATKILEALP